MNKIKYLLFAIFVVLVSTTNAQESIAVANKKERKDVKDITFIDAINIYAKVAEQDLAKGIENPKLFLRLASSYYYNAAYDKAAKWYGHYYNLKGTTPTLLDNYRFGQVLKVKGHLEKADNLLQTYYEYKGLRYRTSNIVETPEINNEYRYTPKVFRHNSEYAEYPATVFGTTLYLATNNTPNKKYRKGRVSTSNLASLDVADGKIKNLSSAVNTTYNEGSMVFTKDGKTMYFSRNDFIKDRVRKTKEDVVTINIYKATLEAGEWKKITSLPFNSQDYSTGHPALSKDEKTFYFISDIPGGKGGTDLYSVPISEDGTFGAIKNMDAINTIGKEMFPFVDADDVLYFSSDRAESIGGLDVFMAPLGTNKTYNRVFSPGNQINSSYDDFGYVVGKNRNVYIGSNRNLGADDIFSFLEKRKFIFPTMKALEGIAKDYENNTGIPNLKVSILDKNDMLIAKAITNEFGRYQFLEIDVKSMSYIIAEKEGYQTLEKNIPADIVTGSKVALDIKMVKMKGTLGNFVSINGVVSDQRTGKPIKEGTINLLDIKNKVLQTVKTTRNGTYSFKNVEPKFLAFMRVEKKGYQTEEFEIEAKKFKNSKLRKNVSLVQGSIPIELGSDIGAILSPIYFDYAKSEIREDARTELNKVVQILKKYPTLFIAIGAHTDSRSGYSTNLALSKRRALSTYNFLIENGIKRGRLTHKGFGESQLLNDCTNSNKECSEEEHQLNRRSSFTITKQ